MNIKKVLIAEDEAQNRLLLTRIVGRNGFETSCVENGQEVIEKLESETFNLLLLDISMPILDGIETTLRIRKLKNDNANIPIILISGNNAEYLANTCREIGATDFIVKPYDLQMITNILKKYNS
ncbi:MAG: response regulator [Bacteroidales bacterium]|nr:response regulator [Bacteroidales bacterium]